MTALTRFFFRPPAITTSTWSIVQWWESRRVAFNLSVGAAGLVSLAVVALADLLPPLARHPGVPWQAVVLYGVLANVCYSIGPALDALIVRRWGSQYAAVGPTLFRYGYAFAMGLTLLPVPLACVGWALRLARVLL